MGRRDWSWTEAVDTDGVESRDYATGQFGQCVGTCCGRWIEGILQGFGGYLGYGGGSY